MSDKSKPQGCEIPTGKLSRMSKLGSLATRIAGNMVSEGISELSKGNRPKVKDLLLTPSNMLKVADQLAQMRGAAMKVGQLLSMDAGELLPAELTDVLARLRSDAHIMPNKDLEQILQQQWGEKWRDKFIQFSPQPIAAASIGQVHKAISKDLERMAVKIQYPGIKQSIDSDVDNVAVLIKMSGLLPKQLNLKPLLEEAKKQLHQEANYQLEAKRIEQYKALVEGEPGFDMPRVYTDYCSDTILAMSFMDGSPIESLVDASQSVRDAVASDLFRLFFKELFDFGVMQTDPNFANFLYNHEQQQIVLLDFGATRDISPKLRQGYRQLMLAGKLQDAEKVHQAAEFIGLLSTTLPEETQKTITQMCMDACEPLHLSSPYDFSQSDLSHRLQEQGMAMGLDKTYQHTPPADCIFLHRKLGGLFLLAIKLKAKVDFEQLFAPYLGPAEL